MDHALERFGAVDALITNAGIVRRAPFDQTTSASFEAHFAVHLKGTFYACRAAWQHMAERHYGRIVTVVSSALFGIDEVSAYAAAKGGVAALTRCMALEGAGHGIKVNAVAPVAYTRMTATGRAGGVSGLHTHPNIYPPIQGRAASVP